MSTYGRPRAAAISGATEVRNFGRAPLVVVVLLTLAVFGPYVTASIRTEQTVLYSLAAILVLAGANFNASGGRRFLLPWIGFVVVAALAALFPTNAIAPYAAGNLLGGYDNLIAPIAVMFVIWTVVPAEQSGRAFEIFAKVLAGAMSLNAAVVIIGTRFDLAPVLRPFWGTADLTVTTAELAASMGRLSGIFNQPAEAGVMYSLAGIAAIYAWKNRPWLLAVILLLISIGGMISVSKIFVLGGLPVIVVYWLIAQRGRAKATAIFATALVGLGVLQSGLLDEWTGFNYLARLLNPESDGGALAFYTAGRLAQDSNFSTVISKVIDYSPIVGVGPAGWTIPFDGMVAEAMVYGGVIGLCLVVTTTLALFTLARKGADRETRLVGLFFAIVIAGGSLGFAPLTANRVSVVSWLFIALLVLMRRAGTTDPQRETLTGDRDRPEDPAVDATPGILRAQTAFGRDSQSRLPST